MAAVTSAKIVYLEDGAKFEFTPPGSEDSFEEQEVPDEGIVIFEDPDDGKRYLVALANCSSEDLEGDTVYILTKCETEAEDEEGESEIDPTLADPVAE